MPRKCGSAAAGVSDIPGAAGRNGGGSLMTEKEIVRERRVRELGKRKKEGRIR
nr:MAG TPA: hypothetical protein [Caudoviricetes sp.]